MKRTLLVTVSIASFAMAGAAFAAQTGSAVLPNSATADTNLANATVDGVGHALAQQGTGEAATPTYAGAGAYTADHAAAISNTHAYGAQANVPSSANAQIQFQVGNDNQSVNLQDGTRQTAATLQYGNTNGSVLSQAGADNTAAVLQEGNSNTAALFQSGSFDVGASASFGNSNSSVILQSAGKYNYAANFQKGNSNEAVTFQNKGNNGAAQIQDGNSNTSFISQGGGDSNQMAAVDGTLQTVGLPGGILDLGATQVASVGNTAASIQLGNSNVSAIIQQGNNNQAVNYQKSN